VYFSVKIVDDFLIFKGYDYEIGNSYLHSKTLELLLGQRNIPDLDF